MDENISIPKHWKVKKLGEEFKCVTGTTPPKNDSNNYGDYIPFVKPPQLLDKPINDAPEKLSEKGKNIARILPINSVLVTCIGSLGRTAINKTPVAFNQQINAILPSSNVDEKFLFYQVQSPSFRNQLEKQSTATTIALINKSKFENLTIGFPPLPEQQAIVAKIEELFSELENGKQQLLTAQQQLKVYRQSLLKAAFEGKLTNSDVKDGELPEGWKWVKLTEIGNAIDPQPSHRTPPVVTNGIPFVSIKDFDSEKDKIDFDNARRVSLEVLQEHLNRYILEKGDFVIGKIGTIGKPVRITLPQNYAISANIVLIQPRQVNPTFLYYYFQSNIILKAFTDGVKATTQAAFGIQKVRELLIVMPTPEEQRLIVSELESKLTVCDKIEETISNSLQQAESLRQSILKRAFEGKLVEV